MSHRHRLTWQKLPPAPHVRRLAPLAPFQHLSIIWGSEPVRRVSIDFNTTLPNYSPWKVGNWKMKSTFQLSRWCNPLGYCCDPEPSSSLTNAGRAEDISSLCLLFMSHISLLEHVRGVRGEGPPSAGSPFSSVWEVTEIRQRCVCVRCERSPTSRSDERDGGIPVEMWGRGT